MRSLSPTLLPAQQSSSSVPYVKVEVTSRIAGVARPLFTRHYTGSEPAFYHGATMPGDGSLVRARVNSTSGTLYVQRVVNPGPSSNFSTWTSLGTASTSANIAVCSQGSQVLIFYVDSNDNRSIYHRESTDYGATWNTAVKVINPAVTAVEWVATAIKPGGTIALFYGSDTATVYVMKKTGGSWSNPSSWSNSVATLTGMVATYYEDWDLLLTGTDTSGDYHMWATIYGDGTRQTVDTWSSLRTLTSAKSDSQIQFHNPFLTLADVLRLSFVEQHTGTVTYQQPLCSHSLASASFADDLWREPVPFDLDTQYGLALASDGSGLWLSTPSGVWEGDVSPIPLDISDDVLTLATREEPNGASAQDTSPPRGRRPPQGPLTGSPGGSTPAATDRPSSPFI